MAKKRVLSCTTILATICAFVFVFSPHLSMASPSTSFLTNQTPNPKPSRFLRGHHSSDKYKKSSLFLPLHGRDPVQGSEMTPAQHIEGSSPITEKGLLYMYGSLLLKYTSLKCEVRGLFNRLIHRGHGRLAESLLATGIPLVDLILMFEDEVRMCMVEDDRFKLTNPARKRMSHGGSSHMPYESSSSKMGKHTSISLFDILKD